MRQGHIKIAAIGAAEMPAGVKIQSLHLTDNILLDDIAAAVGYTSYYLTKKFYRETGQRMTDYINHAKIQYACVQLTGTDKTLQQISEELHYSSRSYFTAVFRKVIGCSPTEYRNNGGNKP